MPSEDANLQERVLAAYEAAGADGDWSRAKDALVAAIASADLDALEALFVDVEPVAELFFGEGSLWPEAADALILRAMAAEDGPRVLGWAIRACACDPTVLVRADRSLRDPARSECAEAFGRHVASFRSWLADPTATRRLAGAHALAWCGTAGADDLAAVLDLAPTERNAPAVATYLLTLGVVLHRTGLRGEQADATRTLARGWLTHKNGVIRVCAAAALALLGDRLDAAAVGALTDAIAAPAKLPPEWGWRSLGPPIKTDQVACAVLVWADLEAREEAVRGLLATAVDTQPLGVAHRVGDALAHAAFGSSGPVAASELDDLGRTVLTEIAAGRHARVASRVLVAIGLPSFSAPPGRDAENLNGFLAQTDLDWRPFPVTVAGVERRWHFARIRLAVLAGELDVEAACKALAEGCTPADLVVLAARVSDARDIVVPGFDGIEYHQRDQALSLALIEAAVAAGIDFAPIWDEALAEPFWWRGSLLAIALLRAGVAERYAPLVAYAVASPPCAEPFRTLLAATPATFRHAVLRSAHIGTGSWPFWDLGLDDPLVVRKLVLHGQNHAWRRDRPRVVQTLAKGGPAIVPVLRAIEYANPTQRLGGEAVVAEVIAAMG